MEPIDLRGVPETMLQTLYARARETQKAHPHIEDQKAVEIVSHLDYDFSNASADKAMSTGVIARTILLDRMVRTYLNVRPQALVLNLACGLDTRCYRMEGMFARWYNLDLPQTMEIRRKFLPEQDPICQVGCSATDPAWADQVEWKQEPVLVILEGLTMYLSREEVQKIFAIVAERFPGATVFAEVMNPWVVTHMKEKSIEGSQAKFVWGVKHGKDLEALLPGYRCLTEKSLTEGMKVFLPIYRFLGKIGFVRNISNKILVMQHDR